uniref:dnaJ homolog subfamily C member 16-like n=1 Tax=Styela clava TaxID=7725 RepID=UPI001939F66A|nr:dnaJ homolog subfamily C member 16-like [Styela clava]
MRIGICSILYACLLTSTFCETVNFDPYEVMSLDHSASQSDVRSKYKKLVKEWHPDKNKSPNAQEKFIKIQQAYEILSDENKREQYDTGGYTGDNVGQWHHQSESFNFRYSDFSHDFFSSQGSSRTISIHDYYTRILPDSHHTPHLIYVYSTFCAQCILWLRTTWHKAASDIENLGVAVYTVDTTFTSRIAVSLGVTRVPTIIGMYKEKIYYFKGQISREELKFFINSFLPSNLVTPITDDNAKSFLSAIELDDKPRALLFSEKPTATLLYRLMALKYKRYIKFGHVKLNDDKTAGLTKAYGVSTTGPTLLVFKENVGKPAVVLGSNEMPRGAINEILSSNKFVVVPRLTSQDVFDEVCPAPYGTVSSVRLCMILVSDNSFMDHAVISGNLKKLVEEAESKEENLNEWLVFMQVYLSKQPAFTSSLKHGEIDKPHLLLLWRRGNKMSSVKWLDIDFLKQPYKIAKQEFQVCLRMALETAHLQRFQSTVSLSPLIDELAPFFVLQVLQTMVDILETTYGYITRMGEKQFMTLLMLPLFCVFLFHSLFSSEEEENVRNTNRRRQQTKYTAASKTYKSENDSDTTETEEDVENINLDEASKENLSGNTSILRNKRDLVSELLPNTYETAVLNQTRGHMTVILLLDEDSDNRHDIMQEYCDVMKVFTRDPKISVTYLDVRKYSSWYNEIRRSSSAEPPQEHGDGKMEDMSSLHGYDFDKVNSFDDRTCEPIAKACGTVLALNGARHWYCIFVPRGVKWSSREAAQNLAEHSTEQESYNEALSCWMDRVREGQMPRLYVRQWPGLYVHSEENEEEED